jgi:hypothetical protein
LSTSSSASFLLNPDLGTLEAAVALVIFLLLNFFVAAVTALFKSLRGGFGTFVLNPSGIFQ